MAFTYCCDVATTSAAVEAIVNSSAALCLDLEWDSHDPNTPLSLIQAATGTGTGTGTGQPFLLDVVRVPSAAAVNVSRMSSLGEIIASQHPVAMHAAAQDRLVLQRHGIALVNLFDTQIAHELLTGARRKSLRDVLQHWLGIDISKGGELMRRFMQTPHAWTSRPLPDYVLDYAAEDVRHLPQLYATMKAEAERRGADVLDQILVLSRGDRVSAAAASAAKYTATIKWFDRKKGYGFASPEGGGDDLFVHALNFAKEEGNKQPFVDDGDIIYYDLGEYNGRPTAVNVTPADRPARSRRRRFVAREQQQIPQPQQTPVPLQEDSPPALAPVPAVARIAAKGKGKGAAAAVARETALAFLAFLDANVEVRAECEDKDAFRRRLAAWRAEEAAAGRQRQRHKAQDVLFQLLRAGKAAVAGSTIAFLAHGGKRAKQEALAASAGRVEANRSTIEADKGGVAVSGVALPETVRPGETATCQVAVRNHGAGAALVLRRVEVLRRTTGFACQPCGELDVRLPPGGEVTLVIECSPRHVGMCYETLSITFDDEGAHFTVGRFLSVSCGDPDVLDVLKATAPYQRPKRRRPPPAKEQVTVIAPPSEPPSSVKLKLPTQAFGIKPEWRRKMESGSAIEELEGLRARLMSEPSAGLLSLYADLFAKLLWLEERQLVADLSNFDLIEEKAVTLDPRGGGLLAVHVHGLAEKRPSVLKGDTLRVNRVGEPKVVYLGRAALIEKEDVLLRLKPQLGYICGQKVEVRFVMNRGPLRIFHQGLSMLGKLAPHVLFPPSTLAASLRKPPRTSTFPLRFSNRSVGANEAQAEAVRRVVEGEARAVPYCIFGPPGTGKTTTVVELVLQCRKLPPSVACCGYTHTPPPAPAFRILVSAPTNTAADLLCSRLATKGLRDPLLMLRLNSYSRTKTDVPSDVFDLSCWSDGESAFTPPPLLELLSKSVVVATLSMAGKLVNFGVPRGHFDLLVIDEAGQALEPEAVAPIATLLGSDGQLVLAGDPRQLGPVIHDTRAQELGLATSLLERMMARPLYGRSDSGSGDYNPLVLTKLVQNYRSHEVLLRLPNELFYEGELLPCADAELQRHCCGREYSEEPLDTKGLPLIFDGVVGKDEREGSSPSWFNSHECQQVMRYVQALLRVRGRPLAPADIGVITPYNRQAQKLSRLLAGAELPVGKGGIKVGSTELFQGQERKVIILSTVRSSADQIGFDVAHNLGFLQNPKRFNVATTRACCLMIVVGNPHVLATDPHWGHLLRLCVQLGAYRGVPAPTVTTQTATTGSARAGGSGGGGDGALTGDGGDGVEELTRQLEQLMLGADSSERVLQEGMAMPVWE